MMGDSSLHPSDERARLSPRLGSQKCTVQITMLRAFAATRSRAGE